MRGMIRSISLVLLALLVSPLPGCDTTNVINLLQTFGVNGTVYAVFTDSSSNTTYVGGAFTVAHQGPPNRDLTVNGIAKTDGDDWTALGTGVSGGNVLAIAVDSSDRVYIGGTFTSAGGVAGTSKIARWTGSAWESVIPSGAVTPSTAEIRALAVIGTTIYAGGSFASINGVAATNVAQFDGVSTWSTLAGTGGEGVGDTVNVIAVDTAPTPDVLYVGGAFSTANVGAAITTNRVARWAVGAPGTWAALGGSGGGEGVDGPVNALTIDKVASPIVVYVGGTFSNANVGSSTVANRIARWTFGAPGTWAAVAGGFSGGDVNALGFLDFNGVQTIFAGGSFTSPGNRAAKFVTTGASWTELDSDGLDDTVHAVYAEGPNRIWYGGPFLREEGFQANFDLNRISKYDDQDGDFEVVR